MNTVPDRSRVRLPDISSRAYEHPADRSALVALRKLTGFDVILRNLAGLFNDRSLRLLFLASSVRASEQQFPHLYQMMLDGALRARPAAGPGAVHQPGPDGQRDGDRHGQAIHRDHDRHGGPDGRRGDPVRHRARARARAVRPRGLPDDALLPDHPGRPAGARPVRLDRAQGRHLGPGGVVPQVRAVLRPGRPAGRARTWRPRAAR